MKLACAMLAAALAAGAQPAPDYDAAAAEFRKAAEEAGDDAGRVAALRGLASALRLGGRLEEAEKALLQAWGIFSRDGKRSDILSELAAVQRAAGRLTDAIVTLDSAVRIHRPADPAEYLARDLTALAQLRVATKEPKLALETYARAVEAWDRSALPDSPQALVAVDALADLYRDASEYALAEPLYLRSLRAREAAFGPAASELLGVLDSLAYTYFGLKKYAEAEPVYKRLLALWEASAGPDHPMVALTLDKMAEFYSAQERRAEAEPLMARAVEMRTRALIESLGRQGRVLRLEGRLEESERLAARAVRLGEDSGLPDERMDPLLRAQSSLLRELKKTAQADAIDKRVKAALLRKADREGRRLPPTAPARPSK